MLSTVSKAKKTRPVCSPGSDPGLEKWLRFSLTLRFLLCGFLMDGRRIQSAFPVTCGIKAYISFLSVILPFNILSKYVSLTQEVSQPLSFNSFLGKTHTCLWLIHQHHPRPLSQPEVFISGLSFLLILFPLFSFTAYFVLIIT